MSKPNKTGTPTVNLLSDDNGGASTSEHLAPYQAKLDRVLEEIISSSSQFEPVSSERLRSVLRAKLWRMGQKLYKLNSRKKQELLTQWKKCTWELVLRPTEVRSSQLTAQSQLEKRLEEEIKTRHELETRISKLDQESKSKAGCKRKVRKSWDEYTPATKEGS